MKYTHFRLCFLSGIACSFLNLPARAALTIVNDVWQSTGSVGNDLLIAGRISSTDGIDFGMITNSSGSFHAVELNYETAPNRLTTDLYNPSGTLVWRDNAGATPKVKMQLDSVNSLQLFTGSGSPSITLNGSSGNVTTSGALSTGTLNVSGSILAGSTPGSQLTISGISIGRGAGGSSLSTAIGSGTLGLNATGEANTVLGSGSLFSNVSTSHNVAIGVDVMKSKTTGLMYGGIANIGVGNYALQFNDGSSNVAIGYGAINSYTPAQTRQIGTWNTAVGHASLNRNTSGSDNVSMGTETMLLNTTGTGNVALGFRSLLNNTTGDGNSSIGKYALYFSNTGYNNSVLGTYAGTYCSDGVTPLTSPDNSIYIGSYARGFSNDDANSIVIGFAASGKGPNTTVLGNASTERTYIYGGTALAASISNPVDTGASQNVFILGNGASATETHTAMVVSKNAAGSPSSGTISLKSPVIVDDVPLTVGGSATFNGAVSFSKNVVVLPSASLTVPAKGGISMGDFAP